MHISKIFLCVIVGFFIFSVFGVKTVYGLERDGRWLKHNGEYIYFVGYDMQELFATKSDSYADVDYMLDQLAEFRINKVRVWANVWFKGDNAYYPWAVSGGKKNLDAWDTTYWQRMRDFVQKAKDRGIVVEISIFSPYPNDNSWWNSASFMPAWNKSYNSNNAFSSNANNNFWPQFFDLNYSERSSSGKTLKDYQKALIDKIIDELKGFGNVYFEVMNEFPGHQNNCSAINQVYDWQQYWAEYMHNTKSALTVVHANETYGLNICGIQYFKNQSYVDILNFHFYASGSGNIDQISDFLHPLQTTGKILQNNESFAFENTSYTDATTREAWAAFVSGAYYFFYQDTTEIIGTSAWRTNAERLKTLRNVAESVSFWQLSPIDGSGNEYDSLVSQGPGNYWQVSANPGNEYVAYFAISPSSSAVKINLPTGNYNYKYYDTRSWNSNGILNGFVVSTGGTVLISAPSTGSWSGNSGLALVIQKTNASSDVNSDGNVNIKDIQSCIKVITGQETNQGIVSKCQAIAEPTNVANIKDIQVIIQKIINP